MSRPSPAPRPTDRRSLPVLAAIAAATLGCGPERPGAILPPPDAGRPSNPSCLALPPPPAPGRVALERAFPTAIGGSAARQLTHVILPSATHPGFVTRLSGRVLAFGADDAAPATIALDLTGRIFLGYGENGLVSIALDPGFASNGFAYVVYSAPPTGTGLYLGRVARFTWDGARFDPSSELVILDVPQVDITHSVNHVAFGADGFLYVSLGDQRRTNLHAQNPTTLPGKLLRLDVAASQASEPYRAPPDNPFVATGADEVYAIGLRNPWRFTVDPVDGSILLGDVGQDRREELDRIVAGGNYGWPAREGTLCFASTPCDDPAFLDPIVELSHAEIRSIVAGYRYRRADVPGLEGRVVFSDFVTGGVWSVDPASPGAEARLEVDGRFSISAIGLDDDGVPVFVRFDPSGDDGGLYRMVPNVVEASAFPRRLSETGCVDPNDPREPSSAMARFTPVAELWSDGADKSRVFAIPDGTAIGVDADGDFVFPIGSVLLKHFGFGGVLHETRLLMRVADGWTGYSYRWDAAQTDAELLPGAITETLPNGVRWLYPGRGACFTCHTSAAGTTLGLEAAQLSDQALASLLELGYFDRRITSLAAIRGARRPALVDPFGDADVADRARSYLHANCAMCHRPGGPGRGDIDLRVERPFAETRLCDAEPHEGRVWDVGSWDEQRLIVPGRPDLSILSLRTRALGYFRMPPLGSDVVDAEGTAVIDAFIDGLVGCP